MQAALNHSSIVSTTSCTTADKAKLRVAVGPDGRRSGLSNMNLVLEPVVKTSLLIAGVRLALFVAELESFGYAESGCVGLFNLFVVPGFSVCLMIRGVAKNQRRTVVRGAAILVSAFLAFVAAALVARLQVDGSKRRGDQLCEAIEAFRKAKGALPASLVDLVPDFLQAVPPSCMSLFRDFPYLYAPRADGLDYWLAFHSRVFIVCARGRSDPWRCDD